MAKTFSPKLVVCDCQSNQSYSEWPENLNIQTKTLFLDDSDLQFQCVRVNANTCDYATLVHISSFTRKMLNVLLYTATEEAKGKESDLAPPFYMVNWKELRLHIAQFQYLIYKMLENQSTDSRLIWIEFKQLLVTCGQLTEIAELWQQKRGPNYISVVELLHLHLEIRLNMLEMLSIVPGGEEVSLLCDHSFAKNGLEQAQTIILCEIMDNAFYLYQQALEKDKNVQFLPIFPCQCYQYLLVRTLKSFKENHLPETDLHPFWNIVNKLYTMNVENSALDSVRSISMRFRCDLSSIELNNSLVAPWITLMLLPTFEYDDQLQKTKKRNCQTNYVFALRGVHNLLKKMDAQETVQCDELYACVRVCYDLCEKGCLSAECVLPLLDYIVKRINSTFRPNSILCLEMIPRESRVWANQMCLNYWPSQDREQVYTCFLALLHLFTVQTHESGDLMAFTKLKGRLYTKLQPKKLDDLNEVGIYNLLSLFLALVSASGNSWIDLVDKFGDVIKNLKKKNTSNSCINLILKSGFAFYHLIQNRNNCDRITNLLSSLFNEIVDSMPAWSSSNLIANQVHGTQATLLHYYLDEVLYFFDEKKRDTLPSSLSDLLTNRMAAVLHKMSESEVGAMLHVANRILQFIVHRIRIDNGENNELTFTRIYKMFIEHYLGFLKCELQSKCMRPEVPDIAFNLTYLTLKLSQEDDGFFNCVKSLSAGKQLNLLNTCEYLSKVLQNYETCERLRKSLNQDFQSYLLEMWCRAAITVECNSSILKEFTRLVSDHCDLFKRTTDQTMFQCVCINIAKQFENLEYANKHKLILDANRVWFEMLTEAKRALSEDETNEAQVLQIYSYVSILMKTCPAMIYMPSNSSSALPVILESLYNPIFIGKLPATRQIHVFSAIKINLTMFFADLADFGKARDAYLDRKVKQMLQHFIPHFASSNEQHPVAIALENGGNMNEYLFLQIYAFMQEQLLNKTTHVTNSLHLLNFLVQIYTENSSYALVREKMFLLWPALLGKMLICDEIIKKRIKQLLALLLHDSLLTEQQKSEKMLEYFEQFLRESGSLLPRALKVLEQTLCFCPQIRDKLIALALQVIREQESAYGSNNDSLRQSFQQFVSNTEND